MEAFRLKLKVGPHEFEAEGSQESVEKQLAIWRDLIASPSATPPVVASPPPPPAPAPQAPGAPSAPQPTPPVADPERVSLDRLFRHDGRVVSLTALPTGDNRTADAALLITYGQRVYNGKELVTGQEVMDGLEQSGLTIERIDRSWGPHQDVNVIRTGTRRGVRYRLTNPGNARAKEIVRDLLAILP